jgi:hypothetical protein
MVLSVVRASGYARRAGHCPRKAELTSGLARFGGIPFSYSPQARRFMFPLAQAWVSQQCKMRLELRRSVGSRFRFHNGAGPAHASQVVVDRDPLYVGYEEHLHIWSINDSIANHFFKGPWFA